MGEKRHVLRGIYHLSYLPLIDGITAVLFLYLFPLIGYYPLPPIALFIILLYPLVFYVLLLSQKVTYSDFNVLDEIVIPEAPRDIKNLLMKTTRGTYRLVNVEIISSIGKKRVIQSDLVKRVQKRKVNLSHTQINKYLVELEDAGIIFSQKGGWTREYSLTEKGKWCLKAIKKCFPKRQLGFIIRHYFGCRKMPPFPDNENAQKS